VVPLILDLRRRFDPAFHERRREVSAVRARLSAQAVLKTSPGIVALARSLRSLREEVSARFGGLVSCSVCAKERPLPNGRWDGGFCCGGPTPGYFPDDELSALLLAGTRGRHLAPPHVAELAGCAFRGPEGCSLRPSDRPSLCVGYLCKDLERELHARGELEPVEAICERLLAEQRRFGQLLASRQLDALLGARPSSC
jgi:hypothetical protein